MITSNLETAPAGTFNISQVALSQRFVVKAAGPINQIEVGLQGDKPIDLALSLSVGGESLFSTTYRRVVAQSTGLMVLPVTLTRVLRVGEVVTMTLTPSDFARVARVAGNNPDWPPMPIKGGPSALHFRATGPAGVQMAIAAGDRQSVPLMGTPAVATFAPLSVKLAAAGKALQGSTVTFTCRPGSGAGAGGLASCQLTSGGADRGTLAVQTDANGVATLNQVSGALLYYDGQGAFTVTASSPDALQPVTFQLVAAPYANPHVATVVSGNNQSVQRVGDTPPAGVSTFAPLVVKVTDKVTGSPVVGARVRWACTNQTCSFAQTCPPNCGVTGPDGMVSSGPWSSSGGPATFSVGVTGNSIDPISFSESSPPKAGTGLTIVAGDRQSVPLMGGPPAKATFAPLSVRFTDGSGKPVSGATVTFVCRPNAQAVSCQMTQAGSDRGTLAVQTDANGVATLNQAFGNGLWYYYGQGAFTVTASSPDAPLPVAFQLVAAPYANPHVATIVSGNNQTVMRTGDQPLGGTSNYAPLVVKVTDKATGNPVAGARVSWSCSSNQSCSFALTCPPNCGVTGQDGTVSSGSWSSVYGAGSFTVNVTGPTIDPIAFNETSVAAPAPPPVTAVAPQLTIVAGNGQQVARAGSSAMFQPLSVRLTDGSGKPVTGASITFNARPPSSGSCQFDPSGIDRGTITQLTDAAGTATLSRFNGSSGMACFSFTGAFTVTATFGGVTVTFELKVI